jgi:hypothetical protein
VWATDWANLTVAGAFVAGAILGTIATIRVTKVIVQYWERRGDDPPAPRPPGE